MGKTTQDESTQGGSTPGESTQTPGKSTQEILAKLTERFGGVVTPARIRAGGGPTGTRRPEQDPDEQPSYAVIDREHVLPVMEFLRTEAELAFDLLSDVTAVDHLLLPLEEVGTRFAVVYQLKSLKHNHRFQVKARVPESDPTLPSVYDLWSAALWGEREVYDMFGIEFEGNPDMRRLLMPEDYPGYPLRKDYPLRGQGERDAFGQYRSATAIEWAESQSAKSESAGASETS